MWENAGVQEDLRAVGNFIDVNLDLRRTLQHVATVGETVHRKSGH